MKLNSTKLVAVVSVLAGVALIIVEANRAYRGIDYQIVFWGIIAIGAIAFGLYELFGPKRPEDEKTDEPDENAREDDKRS